MRYIVMDGGESPPVTRRKNVFINRRNFTISYTVIYMVLCILLSLYVRCINLFLLIFVFIY